MVDATSPEAERRLALVTGASAGIGAAGATALARRGWEVILGGRDRDRLDRLSATLADRHPGRRFPTLPFDVADPDAVAAALEGALRDHGPIDLLVTSAGVGSMDFLDRLDPQSGIIHQIDTNLTGTILCVRHVLPAMIARRRGTIILVGSMAGMVATPTYSIYAATKFGLKGFAEALRREVGVWGIRVVLFVPGTVDTGFAQESVARRRTRFRTPPRLVLPVDDAGEAIARLADRPRSVAVLPFRMRPLLWLARLWPGMVDWILERAYVRRERLTEIDGSGGGGDRRQGP